MGRPGPTFPTIPRAPEGNGIGSVPFLCTVKRCGGREVRSGRRLREDLSYEGMRCAAVGFGGESRGRIETAWWGEFRWRSRVARSERPEWKRAAVGSGAAFHSFS